MKKELSALKVALDSPKNILIIIVLGGVKVGGKLGCSIIC